MTTPISRKYGLLIIFVFSWMSSILRSSGQCTAVVNTFPYLEGFESGTANWVSGGTNNDWSWGSPAKPTINSAGNGSKCWMIGNPSASFYNFGERSWVQSPCFDLSSVNKPFISFLIFWDSEYRYDGGNIQYSINGGANWFTIGLANEPSTCNTQNWYNISAINFLNGLANSTSGWSGNTQASSGSCQGGNGLGRWVQASHCVPQVANQSQVLFRFTFGSGITCNDYDGFAFDDFYVGNPPAGSSPIDITLNCIGNNSYSFNTSVADCFNTYNWNFGDTASSTNNSLLQSVQHTFSTFGNFNVSLTATGNCISDTTVTKQVRVIQASIQSTDVTCAGDSDGSASINIQGAGPMTTVEWNSNPIQTTNAIFNLPVGIYTASISDDSSCSILLSTTVTESPDARPIVNLGSDVIICPGSVFPLSIGNFKSYLWQDGSSDSTFVIKRGGEVILNVTNSSGCKAVDSLLVTEDCLNDILFPNTFTPNDDGINETFNGVGTIPENYTLRIFDRWGEKIFETNNFLEGWDGKYNGHFTHDGIYIYQAVFTVLNNIEIEKAGRVLLIR